jgi:hypothetical protein
MTKMSGKQWQRIWSGLSGSRSSNKIRLRRRRQLKGIHSTWTLVLFEAAWVFSVDEAFSQN